MTESESDSEDEEIRTRIVNFRPAGPNVKTPDKSVKGTSPQEIVSGSHEEDGQSTNTVDNDTIDKDIIDDGAAENVSTKKPQVVSRRSTRERRKNSVYSNYVVGQQTVDKFIELNLQNSKLITELFKALEK